MNIRWYQHLGGSLAIGAGAGVASGVLYSLMSQGTFLATGLACLAPLPIMIGMLGFGRLVAIVALAAGFMAVAVLTPALEPHVGGFDTTLRAALSFTFVLGLPALWLSYLASMSTPRGQRRWQITAPSTPSYLREFVPVERLLTASVAIVATIVVLGVIIIVVRHGSVETAVDRAAAELTPILEDMLGTTVKLPAGYDVPTMARMIVRMSAPVAAGILFLVLLLNLWLAAKVTQLSGRLQRPWPDIAREVQIPRPYGLLLGIAFATTFLGGAAALIASIVAMVLALAFALQGLAVVHVVSRGWKARGFMLGVVYTGSLLLMPSSVFLFALLGLVESLYSFRNHKAARPPKV